MHGAMSRVVPRARRSLLLFRLGRPRRRNARKSALFEELLRYVVERDGPEILVPLAEREGARFGLFSAHDREVRVAESARVADLGAELVGPEVARHAHAALAK